MKITVIIQNEVNMDGDEDTVVLHFPDVDDHFSMLSAFSKSARAAGFDYWDRTGYATDKGAVTWEYPF